MEPGTLLLVDGTAVAYRAFYAIRELSTRDGRPTNAVFGFIKMLNQLEERRHPAAWAVVFDGGSPEERTRVLESYKAQRKPMPDDLSGQLPLIAEYLDRRGIAAVRMEDQEADDVMATLTHQAVDAGFKVLLATNDKDLFQLVSDRVAIIPPAKSEEVMGPAEVQAKTGVPPSLIPEWLALVGDVSDNIPGVPGVGAKTASRLLMQFGGIDPLYERLADVPSDRLREALGQHRDTVHRNMQLTKLRRDLPVTLDPASWLVRKPDAGRLLSFYDQLEFTSLAKGLKEQSLF